MPEYRITEKAGPYIAGRKSTGPGTTVFLTPREAGHDLRVGAIEPVAAAKASTTVGTQKGGSTA